MFILIFSHQSEASVNYVYGAIGRFDPTNHGFQEFIGNNIEYSAFLGFGNNPYFNIQTGLSFWKEKKQFADKDYQLSSILIPIQFIYRFHPSEKWVPYFGSGAGIHMLLEKYEQTELFWTISYNIFSGFQYNIKPKLFINSEITYSYGNFSGIDNLKVEGLSFRLGLGRRF